MACTLIADTTNSEQAWPSDSNQNEPVRNASRVVYSTLICPACGAGAAASTGVEPALAVTENAEGDQGVPGSVVYAQANRLCRAALTPKPALYQRKVKQIQWLSSATREFPRVGEQCSAQALREALGRNDLPRHPVFSA